MLLKLLRLGLLLPWQLSTGLSGLRQQYSSGGSQSLVNECGYFPSTQAKTSIESFLEQLHCRNIVAAKIPPRVLTESHSRLWDINTQRFQCECNCRASNIGPGSCCKVVLMYQAPPIRQKPVTDSQGAPNSIA